MAQGGLAKKSELQNFFMTWKIWLTFSKIRKTKLAFQNPKVNLSIEAFDSFVESLSHVLRWCKWQNVQKGCWQFVTSVSIEWGPATVSRWPLISSSSSFIFKKFARHTAFERPLTLDSPTVSKLKQIIWQNATVKFCIRELFICGQSSVQELNRTYKDKEQYCISHNIKTTYIFFISFNRTSYKHNNPHFVIFSLPMFQHQLPKEKKKKHTSDNNDGQPYTNTS